MIFMKMMNIYFVATVSIKLLHFIGNEMTLILVTGWKTKEKTINFFNPENPELSTTWVLLEFCGIVAWEKVGISNSIPERCTQNLMNQKQKRGSGLSLGVLVSEAEHSVFCTMFQSWGLLRLRLLKWVRVLLVQQVDTDPKLFFRRRQTS